MRGRTWAAFAIVAGVLGGLFAYNQSTPPSLSAVPRVMDRRCRGGCTSSGLSILPSGAVPSQYGQGSLLTAGGLPVTDTRASNKTCRVADGGLTFLSSNTVCVEPNGIFVEGPATNLALQSNALTNTNGGTVTTSGTAPDGTSTAQLFTDNGVSGEHRVILSGGATITVGNATYTESIYGFAGTYKYIALWNTATTGTTYVMCDVLAGTVAATGGGATGAITALGGGWYRCTAAIALTAGSPNVVVTVGDTIAHATPQTSWSGGSGTISLAFAQFEQGAFATSYIPTTTTSATRASDQVQTAFTVNGNNFSAALTVVAFEQTTQPNFTRNILLAAGVSNSANSWALQDDANGSGVLSDFAFQPNDSTGTPVGINGFVTPAAGDRVACSVSGGFGNLYRNGSLLAGPTAIGSQNANQTAVYIGVSVPGGQPFWGWLSNICVSPIPTGCR